MSAFLRERSAERTRGDTLEKWWEKWCQIIFIGGREEGGEKWCQIIFIGGREEGGKMKRHHFCPKSFSKTWPVGAARFSAVWPSEVGVDYPSYDFLVDLHVFLMRDVWNESYYGAARPELLPPAPQVMASRERERPELMCARITPVANAPGSPGLVANLHTE